MTTVKNARFVKELSGGDRRSIGKSENAVADVLADARLFAPLFACMLEDDPLVRMRAADAVEKVTSLRPDFLQPFKKRIIEQVARINQQEIRWHVAQMFPRLDLSKTERQQVMLILKEYLGDKSSIVKTMSMQALADIARKDKRLKPSIVGQLEALVRDGTPAMKARGKKLLDGLREQGAGQMSGRP